MNPSKKSLKKLDRKALRHLAQALAQKYGSKDVVIGLSGNLGAGKTAFVKDFAAYFGIKKIKSPTFIIGSVYPLKQTRLYHYDFYRLERQNQLIPLGFEDILASRHRIVLVEWIEKFPEIAKRCDVLINLEISGKNTRNVTIENKK